MCVRLCVYPDVQVQAFTENFDPLLNDEIQRSGCSTHRLITERLILLGTTLDKVSVGTHTHTHTKRLVRCVQE